MKAKLYLIISLLAMSSLNLHGQTFTSHLYLEFDKTLNGCDIVENTDHTLLAGTRVSSDGDLDDHYLICKITPTCELLDSLSFSAKSSVLLVNQDEPDHYVLPEFQELEAENTVYLKLTQIDDDLNILEEVQVPIANLLDGIFRSGRVFIDPQNNVVASFWMDNAMHLVSTTVDGTINASKEISEVFMPNFSYQHPADTALCYSSFGVYSETPLQYYLIGGYINDDASSHLWPFYNYIFDEELNLVETVLFEHDRFGNQYDWCGQEQIVSLDENTYILSDIHFDNVMHLYWTSINFFNRNHYLIHGNGHNSAYGHPVQIAVSDNGKIYYSFVNHNSYFKDSKDVNRVKIIHYDFEEEEQVAWQINTPTTNLEDLRFGDGQRMIVLENGNLALCFTAARAGKYYLIVYIIRDEYVGANEYFADESPFTLYPNPVKDLLSLRFDDGIEPENVELYDISGRLVDTKCNGLESIDMCAMPAGVYMLRVTMKDGTRYYEKILKD